MSNERSTTIYFPPPAEAPVAADKADPRRRQAGKGLGMTIVQAFVRQIGGAPKFGRCESDRRAKFTVLFS